jgi:CheY-like chemotaxis protein
MAALFFGICHLNSRCWRSDTQCEGMKKILIIEDDHIVGTVYRQFLQAHGFETDVAVDGAAGLERVETFRPDAIVLDLMMPKVNGIEVLRRIRTHPVHHHLPVIVMTAAAIPILIEQAAGAGANRIFDKSNDKPLAIVGALHDILNTTSDSRLVAPTKSGNPEAVLEYWPARNSF